LARTISCAAVAPTFPAPTTVIFLLTPLASFGSRPADPGPNASVLS
jgi:hypothetical protein